MNRNFWKKAASFVLALALILTGVHLPTLGYTAQAEETATGTAITLTNADFSSYIWGSSGGWSIKPYDSDSNEDWDYTTTSNGSNDTNVTGSFNFWRQKAGTVTLTQSVTLEAGTYQMGADVYGEKTTVSFVFSGTAETTERTVGSSSSYVTVTSDLFTLETKEDVTVGVQLNLEAGGWGYLDDVTLTKTVDSADVSDGDTDVSGGNTDSDKTVNNYLVDGDFGDDDGDDIWSGTWNFDSETWNTVNANIAYNSYAASGTTNGLGIWYANSGTVTMSQTIASLPAGTYCVTGSVYDSNGYGGSVTGYYGDTTNAMTGSATVTTDKTWSDFSMTFTVEEDQTNYTIGFRITSTSGAWVCLDSFVLADERVAAMADLKALIDECSALEEADYTSESFAALSSALTTAQKYYDANSSKATASSVSAADIQAQIDALNNAYGALEAAEPPVEGDLNIDKVENLSDDFIMGMDISSVMSEFASGVTYKDDSGNTIDNITDFCAYLKSKGITHIRVRVWNNPYDSDGNGYGGGNNNVETAKTIADACREAGLKMLVDFHCSDFWTDPSKQQEPKAWADMSLTEKEKALAAYITESLNTIDPNKDTVAMVQIGNETTTGFIGETSVENMCALFSVGAAAVRAYSNSVKIVIHETNPNKGYLTTWAADLKTYNVDYDILATSYYPYWHGSLSDLETQLKTVISTYGKDVMVAETSYAYTLADSDGHDNTVREGNNDTGDDLEQPFSVQGQATAIRNLINTVNQAGGLGVFYWEPAWITVGDTTGLTGDEYDAQVESNKTKWETYGSGWASSYSADYDPDDAGKWYGGSAVDNEAMFYPDGTPTAAIQVWNAVKTGMYTTKVSVDGVADAELTVEQNGTYTLPETVTVSYNTGDVNEAVVWDEEDVTAIDVSKTGTYTVSGTVSFSQEVTLGTYKGLTSAETTCTITVTAPNLITDADDASFENAADSFTASGSGIVSVSDKETPYAGSYCMHWWKETATQGIVTYNKTITLAAGSYEFEAVAQGYAGDTVTLQILDEDDNVLYTGDAQEMNGWKSWMEPIVSFTLDAETTVKLRIVVDMQDGGWGTVDCLYLHSTPCSHTNTEIKNAKDATCAEEGYTGDTYCSDCGELIASGETIDKTTEHTWDDGEVTKEASYTEDGIRTYTCTVCKITKEKTIAKLTVVDDTSKTESETSVITEQNSPAQGDWAPSMKTSPKTLFGYVTLTDSEKEAYNSGTDVDFILKAEKINNASVSEEDIKLINSVLNGYTLGCYLDITLRMQIGTVSDRLITELSNNIQIGIVVPTNLTNTDSSVNRTYRMVRIHNGAVDVLDGELQNGEYVFETDRFSTYALIYKDTSESSNSDDSSDDDVTVIETSSVSQTLNAASPKTGDTNSYTPYIVLLVVAIAGATGLVVCRNRKKSEDKSQTNE